MGVRSVLGCLSLYLKIQATRREVALKVEAIAGELDKKLAGLSVDELAQYEALVRKEGGKS